MSSETAIKVENLSKCYHIYDTPRDRLLQMLARGRKKFFREFWALKNISFEVKRGETVGIVGRNGSGKSTLLQLICGTLNPTEGSVKTNGRIAALLELGAGFNPEFSGRENVYLNAALLGLLPQQIDACYEDILAFADIGDFINQPIKTYSSGMAVRLAFSVQAMVNPDVLIVDEALAVGDERFQRKCFARIETLKSNGTSILFVSHSGPQVVELCDRAILLESGEYIMESEPAEVVRAYQRMIYAPPEDHGYIVEKLRRGESLLLTAESAQNDKIELSRDADTSNTSTEEFDPTLISSSVTRYPERGARIEEIEILDHTGKRVNILKSGSDYVFVVRGEFVDSLERVYFGVHIRSISGAEISGQRFPNEGKAKDLVRAGSRFVVSFRFNVALLPGTYFVGGGVWAADPECAHRVLDAIMFRVLPRGEVHSFGYCDLSAGPAAAVIS